MKCMVDGNCKDESWCDGSNGNRPMCVFEGTCKRKLGPGSLCIESRVCASGQCKLGGTDGSCVFFATCC